MADVRILLVTDGWSPFLTGSYDQARGFSLFHLVATLRSVPTNIVTCAHRAPSSIFAVPGFVFQQPADVVFDFTFVGANETAGDAATRLRSDYDEIWLFGVEPLYPAFGNRRAALPQSDPAWIPNASAVTTHALSAAENEALFRFNDELGGGLFATGDHEDLGWAMCANVPRIRSMRDWWYPADVPFNQDPTPMMVGNVGNVAPSGSSRHRHDTLVLPPGTPDPSPAPWDFYWQNDTTPQRITPVYTGRRTRGPRQFYYLRPRFTFPHPLLCGPNGPLTALPDHPHEGNCRVPDDLTGVVPLDHGTRSRPEWPTPTRARPLPTVVATAHVSVHSTHSPLADLPFLPPVKDRTVEQTYPVICAYDGFPASVGRVVVDATWHHFFNVNVQQMANANPALDPDGARAWADIQRYYLNIAAWLAPVGVHESLVIEHLIAVLNDGDVFEDLGLGRHFGSYWSVGSRARGALQEALRDAGPCVTIDSIIATLIRHISISFPFPWVFDFDEEARPKDDLDIWDPIVLVDTALGVALIEAYWYVAHAMADPSPEKALDPRELHDVIVSALVKGVEQYAADQRGFYEAGLEAAAKAEDDLKERRR